jgi:hypothetical protein
MILITVSSLHMNAISNNNTIFFKLLFLKYLFHIFMDNKNVDVNQTDAFCSI